MSEYIRKMYDKMVRNGYAHEEIDLIISYSNNLVSKSLPIIYDKRHFEEILGLGRNTINSYIHTKDQLYKKYCIPKRNGKFREIKSPSMGFKKMQQWILYNILYKVPVSEFSTGFVPKKSILTNAKIHLNQFCILNLDIKDFFPSITFEQVYDVFYSMGYTRRVSRMLAQITTFEDVLPQGAPTSPYLSNLIVRRLDHRLGLLSKSMDLRYSRYADDITFSGKTELSSIVPIVINILNDEGFIINGKKTRVLMKHQRQEVTGLILTENRVRIPKKFLEKFQQEIYYCHKYGVSNHLEHTNQNYNFYREHMYGKAYYVFMIEKDKGELLLAKLDNISWES